MGREEERWEGEKVAQMRHRTQEEPWGEVPL